MQTLRMNPSPIKKLLVLALLLTALYTSGRGQAPTSMGAGSSVGPARDSMEIRVVAALVVEKDGRISKVDIVENSCRPCSKRLKKNIEAEVLRIIQQHNPRAYVTFEQTSRASVATVDNSPLQVQRK